MTQQKNDYLIPAEVVSEMTQGEKEEYERLLRAKQAMNSPLDYALYVSPKAKRYRHSEYLNQVLLALVEGRLYKSGPGPASVIVDVTEQEPQGRRVHPVTGEPAVDQLMISLPPRIGKQVALHEPIFTPDGLRRFGDLAPGDYVFHTSGAPVRIVAESPVIDGDCRVTFTDNSTLDVHESHEWTVYDRRSLKWRTVETQEIEKDCWIGPPGQRGSRARWGLPFSEALLLPDVELPLDPYFLGVWLGDGKSSAPSVCGPQEDLDAELREIPYAPSSRWVHKTTGVHYVYFSGLSKAFHELGLINNKHIPELYQLGSEAQRRALLAGIVDTDGTVDTTGRVTVSSVCKPLVDGLKRLVASLGYRANVRQCAPDTRVRAIQSKQTLWTVSWTPHDGLGAGRAVQRKCVETFAKRRRIGIRSVERVAAVPGKCIQVESSDGLFLVGETLAATHNSWMVGEHFPAWYLTQHQDEMIMYISHSADLATNFSATARDHIIEHPELGAVMSSDHQSRDEWSLEGQSTLTGMIAKGADGVPTGRGGNLIIDDIFKKGEDVLSDTARQKVHEHYKSSLRPRVNAGCWKILMGTRWHEEDLHGHLLAHEPDKWFVVNIPAISFDTVNEDGVSVDPETGDVDVFMRKPGESVCPELAPLSYYQAAQTSDPFWFDAEYLGKPSGVSGTMFKEFHHYKRHVTEDSRSIYELFLGDESDFVDEKDCVRFGIVDLAITDKQTSDWTVFGVFDLDPWRRVMVREIIRERVLGPEHEDFIRSNAAKWGCRAVGIEDATYGTRVIQDLIVSGGLSIWPLTADKNKKVRAIPAANLFKKKLMFIDRDAGWRAIYETELKKFDRDKHDDQVDVTAYAARMRDYLAANPLPAQPILNPLKGMARVMAELADANPKPEPVGMIICAG